MFKKLLSFHRDLITPTSSVSSSRYIALSAFYVSSWILVYLTWKTQVLPSEIFIAYISVFVLGYLGSKGISAIADKPQNDK